MGPGFESQRDHEKPPFKEAFFVYIIQNSGFTRLSEISMHFGKSNKIKKIQINRQQISQQNF